KDGAVVNLAERGVYLFRGGDYQGFFPLAIGRGDNLNYRTPTGTYKMVDRVKDPTWVAPDSPWAKAMDKEKIEGGSKDNPLGGYWFG
ncbi:L,D-transpeptidase, partial [Streptococcus pneumoniae]|nr:L,D-transpeptidase [Streptococcus pneumoniae]